MKTPEQKREEARLKAWDSLSRYKFLMFGYWAGAWVAFNDCCEQRYANPFASLVHMARAQKEGGDK